ncbi:MAG TPA: aminotransferase class V-fold PLP-dependent enzyme [Gammaproteobacteria bacterium]|nr:aminotransferase class V-fold PLP-dependent enzyme [Gammaproteobacteria bacterium]
MAESDIIYMDYAATTPVDPRVAERMAECLTADGLFGNPASIHHDAGRAARAAVEKARGEVAALIGATPPEIIFTSGATESINLALRGVAAAHDGRHIVTSRIEHAAVLDTCRALERRGYEITYIEPNPDGVLEPERFAAAFRDDTVLCSVMHVNNEIGVYNDIAAIGAAARERDILMHVDGAQSLGKLAINLAELPVDLMSFSAHKIYGPKGAGALYVQQRPQTRIAPIMFGGGQERGMRSGTLATHQIVGMGAACALAAADLDAEAAHIAALRERLWAGLSRLPGTQINGHPTQRVCGILNVSFDGVEGESLLLALTGLAVSTGSACSSAKRQPSYVLRALGRDSALAESSLRFSLGRFSTEADVDAAIGIVGKAVADLRALSPLAEQA